MSCLRTFDILELASRLLHSHGLEHWKIKFDRSKSIAGKCSYQKNTIFLSLYYIQSPNITIEDVKDTILHEIAHALTPGHKHDRVWKAKAIEIGCSGDIYERKPFGPKRPYRLTCPCLKNNFLRHKVHPKFRKAMCSYCDQFLTVTKEC